MVMLIRVIKYRLMVGASPTQTYIRFVSLYDTFSLNHRRSWDPNLVPKEISALDQTISMYNLFPVCLFCAQFFDPDLPGGIAYPLREQAPEKKTGVLAAISAQRDRDIEELNVLRPCYDDRHSLKGGPADRAGTFWDDQGTREARRRARRAVKLVKDPKSGYSGALDADLKDGKEGSGATTGTMVTFSEEEELTAADKFDIRMMELSNALCDVDNDDSIGSPAKSPVSKSPSKSASTDDLRNSSY